MSKGSLLRIYSSPHFLPKGVPHTPMLYPFWGMAEQRAHLGQQGFLEWATRATAHFQLVDNVRESDMAVLPFDWQHVHNNKDAFGLAERMSDLASTAGKKLLVFFFSDSEDEVALPDSVVFRTSLQRGARRNEFAMPAWCDDYITDLMGGALPLRPKLPRASVGFTGFAGYSLAPTGSYKRRARSLVRRIYRRFPPYTVREKAIRVLRGDPRVISDFVLRDQFYAGFGGAPVEARQQVNEEYFRNILANDYVLCARGAGNFSFRFYETLAAGRIPMFIDTNCVLPYDFEVNYDGVMVRVDESEVEAAPNHLIAHHEATSTPAFLEQQRACRDLWVTRLSPSGFFSNLHKHFDLIGE